MTTSALATLQASLKPQREPMYFVVLEGRGRVTVKLVPECVWQWIHQPYLGRGPVHKEPVGENILAEARRYGELVHFRKGKLSITSGSFENDRALAAPGLSFNDVDDANAYAKTNKVPIAETYQGCLY